VSETVEAARLIGRERACGMVNAVLRRYLRERETIEAKLAAAGIAVRESHPDWLVSRLRQDWPDAWETLLAANNSPGPLALRVNLARGTRAAYLQRLQEAGLPGQAAAHGDAGIVLDTPVQVERLPGFDEGLVSVQDLAAQLAAPLLEAAPGHRVLDACAAPGGKTAHLLERHPGIELLALDRDRWRMERVARNLERLQLQARTAVADAAETAAWWDGRPFDRILLDAPCSGTGVIRRHPDIKWLRRESDIAALARQQRSLLDALWPLLAPGGVLLYASCSVLSGEGAGLLQDFAASRADADELPVAAGWGEACTIGRRIRTGDGGMDGFYYARLRRRG
jgi:16S rRNA (cytosine967-C5)-methyltransferase